MGIKGHCRAKYFLIGFLICASVIVLMGTISSYWMDITLGWTYDNSGSYVYVEQRSGTFYITKGLIAPSKYGFYVRLRWVSTSQGKIQQLKSVGLGFNIPHPILGYDHFSLPRPTNRLKKWDASTVMISGWLIFGVLLCSNIILFILICKSKNKKREQIIEEVSATG